MEKISNRKKTLGVLLLIGVSVLLLAGGILTYVLRNRKSEQGETQLADCTLYWNVDLEEYKGTTESGGLSTREKAEDGFFKVVFAVDGEHKELNVSQGRILNRIDSMQLMGLAVDEKNEVTEVYTLDEITGGKLASNFYVTKVSEESIETHSSDGVSAQKDVCEKIKLTDKVGIYDVSGYSEFVGEKTKPRVGDRIMAIRDKSGTVTHVFVTVRTEEAVTVKRYCEHCKEEAEWRMWTNKGSLPTTRGHWILSDNVSLGTQQPIGAGMGVVLDLNGKTVTGGKNTRMYALFEEGSSLAIMDSSKEKTGKMVGSGTTDQGGIIWVRYGVFEMYGGTLDASAVETRMGGAAVHVDWGNVFNMYGGTIVGGTSKANMKDDMSGVQGGTGGSVSIFGAFNLYDGTIKKGKATAYYDKANDKYINGQGGNIYVRKGATFTMKGGTVCDGKAERGGGNIFLTDNATVTVSGGMISGGESIEKTTNGGSIYVSWKSVFNMAGGTIHGGVAHNKGGNMAVYGTLNMTGGVIQEGVILVDGARNNKNTSHNLFVVNATMNMSGGHIKGYVEIVDWGKDKSTVSLSGTAKISEGWKNLCLPEGKEIEIRGLKKGADIRVSAGGFFTGKTEGANAQYVHSDYNLTDILHLDGKLYAGLVHCMCGSINGTHKRGCNQEMLRWLPWNSTESLPEKSGNWYLPADVWMKWQATAEAGAVINLDLNGCKAYGAENKRVYSTAKGNVKLALTDASKAQTGSIVIRVNKGDQGLGLWVTNKSSCTLYGGVIDGTKASTIKNGGVIYLANGCNLTMWDGKVIGGKAMKDSKGQGGFGGGLYVAGNFSMNGGSLVGGSAANEGGNLFVEEKGKVSISGGNISKGKSGGEGGNIASSGNFKMTGGTVEGGFKIYALKKLGLAGNPVIYGANEKTNLYLADNAMIELGSLTTGAKIYVSGSGIISDEAANASTLGYVKSDSAEADIFLQPSKALFMGRKTTAASCHCNNAEGHKHEDVYWAPWRGKDSLPKETGNYYLTQDMTLAGQTTISDGATVRLDLNGKKVTGKENARVISTRGSGAGGVTLEITDTSAEQTGALCAAGKLTGQGGIVWVAGSKSSFQLWAGSLDASKATSINRGVAVEVATGNTFTMYGGTITGGTAQINTETTDLTGVAGSVYVAGTFEMKGGTVTGGKAQSPGGNVHVTSTGTFTMSGGTIEKGVSDKEGGNAVIYGKATVSGGTIDGGYAKGKGGNFFIPWNGTFAMSGGTISAGKSDDCGGNLGVSGKTTITGGTITGGYAPKTYASSMFVNQGDGNHLILKGCSIEGAAYIYDTKASVTVDDNTQVGRISGFGLGVDTVAAKNFGNQKALFEIDGALTDNGKVIALDLGKYTGSADDSDQRILAKKNVELADRAGIYDKKFAVGTGADLMYIKDTVKVIPTGLHVHCACGGTDTKEKCATGHEEILYTKLTSLANADVTADKNWYLDGDLEIGASWAITVKNNATLNLCLNGHTLSRKAAHTSRVIVVGDGTTGGTANVTGLCGTNTTPGTLKSNAVRTSSDRGSIGWARGGPLRLYNVDMNTVSSVGWTSDLWLTGGSLYLTKCKLTTKLPSGSAVDPSTAANGVTIQTVTSE